MVAMVDTILLWCALVSFGLSAFGVPIKIVRDIDLFKAGFAFLTATLLF
jgi:hypothetical protein